MTHPWLDFDEVMSGLWPMRPPLQCPYCARKGHVQRVIGLRVSVAHACPGPWTLEKVEEVTDQQAPYRLTVYHGGRQPIGPAFAELVERASDDELDPALDAEYAELAELASEEDGEWP